jgi:hypothetical protein
LEEGLPGTADRARISGLARHNFRNPHQRQKPSVDIVHVIEGSSNMRNGLPSIAKLRRGTGGVENFSGIGFAEEFLGERKVRPLIFIGTAKIDDLLFPTIGT